MSDSTPNAVLDGLDYPSRELIASIGGRPVGVLSESAGVWKFTYAPEWLAYAGRFALSPALPLSSAPILDGSSLRPVQWYFDNLLPEEAQRQLMATDAGIRAADRSEEHTSELQSLMRISYAGLCLKKKQATNVS